MEWVGKPVLIFNSTCIHSLDECNLHKAPFFNALSQKKLKVRETALLKKK